jgi:hypothetical protein
MSIESSRDTAGRDPRTALVRDKYFSLRPKPLERWIWQQGLSQAAERVFWLHWEEGMRSGDWCSQLPLRRVARDCCVDPSTVTRAYQVLKGLGLIRREDPGRDPGNPFQQATAVTEVRVPRELLVELGRAPNRHRREAPETGRAVAEPAKTTEPSPNRPQGLPGRESAEGGASAARPPETAPEAATAVPAPTPPPHISFRDQQRIQGKFSGTEKAAYRHAWAERLGTMAFEPETRLTPEEQRQVLWQLHLVARPEPVATPAATAPAVSARSTPTVYAGPRRLPPLDATRLRRKVLEAVPMGEAAEVFRQVLWSVEEGALRRFEPLLAINIALKKIREGAWTRPNRMPPNWRSIGTAAIDAAGQGSARRTGAAAEVCSAA